MTDLPKVNRVYRHADGDLYHVQAASPRVRMKMDDGRWAEAVRYMEWPSKVGSVECVTTLERFAERFTLTDFNVRTGGRIG